MYLSWLAHYYAKHHVEVLAYRMKSVGDWSQWLAETDRQEQVDFLRQHVEIGLRCGAQDFVRELELRTRHGLRPTRWSWEYARQS